MNMFRNIKPLITVIGAVLLLLLLLVATRAFRLDQFVTTDETAWFSRSANFYYALGQREFAETFQNNSISAFTMWMNTLGFLVEFPEYRGLGQGYFSFLDPARGTLFRDFGVSEIEVLATGRLFMTAALSLLVLGIFYYVYRLLDLKYALAGALFLALDPFYIALSRTAHLDAPFGTFFVLSNLAFAAYLYAERKSIHLIVSGVAAGFALLSKLPGLLVLPTGFFIAFFYIFAPFGNPASSASTSIRVRWSEMLKSFSVWAAIFTMTFFLFWPAMWVRPVENVTVIVQSSLGYASNTNERTTNPERNSEVRPIEDIESLAKDEANVVRKLLKNQGFYLTRFLWRTTPTVLLGLIFLLLGILYNLADIRKGPPRKVVILLLLTAVFPTLVMSVSDKTSEKYITPFYISMDLLAALGWVCVLHHAWQASKDFRRRYLLCMVAAGVLIAQIFLVFDHFPYYFTYYNPLLGGGRTAGVTRFVGVGEGLDLAAAYLNQLPAADELVVHSFYGEGPFSYFFDGKTVTIHTGTSWSEKFVSALSESDYLVAYSNQWYRRIPEELFQRLDTTAPIQTIWIEDIEYVRIYRITDLTLGSD